MLKYKKKKQKPVVFHFGDHDPSGKDMSRDTFDRLKLFTGDSMKFERLALNMNQIDEYDPPPNPAKITDSRANAYIAEFGGESWELDALEPSVLEALVRKAIEGIVDEDRMASATAEQDKHRAVLSKIAERFDEVEELLAS